MKLSVRLYTPVNSIYRLYWIDMRVRVSDYIAESIYTSVIRYRRLIFETTDGKAIIFWGNTTIFIST